MRGRKVCLPGADKKYSFFFFGGGGGGLKNKCNSDLDGLWRLFF
jgi:hypothetical protein